MIATPDEFLLFLQQSYSLCLIIGESLCVSILLPQILNGHQNKAGLGKRGLSLHWPEEPLGRG